MLENFLQYYLLVYDINIVNILLEDLKKEFR